MNIYKHEFKMKLRSVITWSFWIGFLIFAFTSMFTVIAVDAEIMNDMMANFPPEFLMAFGMDGLDFSTVLGFYSFVFLFCQLLLAIQASNYGFGLVSIEESELTADFLLAKPVGRASILTSKFLAALTGLTITNIVVWISSFVFLNIYKGDRTYETKALVLLLLSIIVFQLFFLTVGIVISLLIKRVRNVTSLSMALAFGMYVLSAFGSMLGEASLEVITPFKHFEPNYIINNMEYDMPLVLLNIAIILIATAGSYRLYAKRDMQSAV